MNLLVGKKIAGVEREREIQKKKRELYSRMYCTLGDSSISNATDLGGAAKNDSNPHISTKQEKNNIQKKKKRKSQNQIALQSLRGVLSYNYFCHLRNARQFFLGGGRGGGEEAGRVTHVWPPASGLLGFTFKNNPIRKTKQKANKQENKARLRCLRISNFRTDIYRERYYVRADILGYKQVPFFSSLFFLFFFVIIMLDF